MKRAGGDSVAVEVAVNDPHIAGFDAVVDNLPRGTYKTAALTRHHVAHVADDGKFRQIDVCLVHLFCDEVTRACRRKFLVSVFQPVYLLIGRVGVLTDVVVDD